MVTTTVASSRGSHSYKACGSIRDQDQNENKGSRCQFVLNKTIKECFKETSKHVRKEANLCKTSICKGFLLEYQAINKCNQAIKVNFCLSKILILVEDGSTGVTKVISPCSYMIGRLELLYV